MPKIRLRFFRISFRFSFFSFRLEAPAGFRQDFLPESSKCLFFICRKKTRSESYFKRHEGWYISGISFRYWFTMGWRVGIALFLNQLTRLIIRHLFFVCVVSRFSFGISIAFLEVPDVTLRADSNERQREWGSSSSIPGINFYSIQFSKSNSQKSERASNRVIVFQCRL